MTMRPGPQAITLGAHGWLVRPLTLAQVQAVEPLLLQMDGAPRGTVASAVAILKVALGRDHPEAAAELDGIEAGAPDVAAAVAAVLRLGGFLPEAGTDLAGNDLPGEAGADRSGADGSTGPRFTAG